MQKQMIPSDQLSDFLNFVDRCGREYSLACDNVSQEDKRLQDLLHEMEFAADKAERNRVATKLQQSRRYRRANKDAAKLYEKVVRFFEDQNNRRVLNQMRQLLGQQRKEEEYLFGERTYRPRVRK